jgi:osomolarity two-component system, sensor histidine kinase NIK1
MQGGMWVESEVSKGSKFFFTITSQISQSSMELTLAKMQPFQKRTILFMDTLRDKTKVVQRIKELGLRAYVVHDVSAVADKDQVPHTDTIVVDSLEMVIFLFCSPSAIVNMLVPQTECIREYEHLRYIPIVLLAPSLPRLNCTKLSWSPPDLEFTSF